MSHVLAVARLRSFSRAAEELHISQPALSRSIAETERRYGIRIFTRGRSGVTITPTGAQVIAEAEALVQQARNLEHNMRLYGEGAAGRISFGMGPLIAAMTLAGLGRQMLADRPRLQMQVSIMRVPALHEALVGDRLELYFCGANQVPSSADITTSIMGTVDICLVARAGHPLGNKAAASFDDVGSYPTAGAVELRFSGRSGALICDNYPILRDVVLGSDAIWVTSPQLVGEDLAGGRLVRIVTPEWSAQDTQIVAVSHREREISPAAHAVTEHVKALLADLTVKYPRGV